MIAPSRLSPRCNRSFKGLASISRSSSGLPESSIRAAKIPLPRGRSGVADEHARQEHQAPADDDLEEREPKAHAEVAVADEGDRHELEAHDEVGHGERQSEMGNQERQRMQQPADERGHTRDRSSNGRMTSPRELARVGEGLGKS